MTLYGGIDLHSNNVMISLMDAQDHPISEKRLPNELPLIEAHLAPYQPRLEGLVVESTSQQAEGLYDSTHTDFIRFPDLVLLVI